MDPEVLAEAKDFVSSGIEKFAGGTSGLDTMVSIAFKKVIKLSKRVNSLKNQWTASSDPHGTV